MSKGWEEVLTVDGGTQRRLAGDGAQAERFAGSIFKS